MLRIDVRVGESLSIGDVATITLEQKSGQVARLAIQADRSIPINRVKQYSPAQFAAKTGITGREIAQDKA